MAAQSAVTSKQNARSKQGKRRSANGRKPSTTKAGLIVPKIELTLDWRQAIDDLREAYLKQLASELAIGQKSIAMAKDRLQTAETALARAKEDYGKRTGHPKVQQAESARRDAARQVTYLEGGATKLDEERRQLINDQHQLLVQAIAAFVDGKPVSELCGAIKLKVEDNGRLNIYFRLDGKPVVRKQGHGHYSVQPNGDMYYMRMHGAPHGDQWYVTPRV